MNIKSIVLSEGNSKALDQYMKTEIEKIRNFFNLEIEKLRTGRAHPSIVEDIRVMAYGGEEMPLKSLAAITTPEARVISIQPWDEGTAPAIEKALREHESLGATPVNDGKVIRITLPEMSSSRRSDLTKLLNKKTEEMRISIRNIRKECNNCIRDHKKSKAISDDFCNRLETVVQKSTHDGIQQLEAVATKKEKEITTI